MVFGDIDAQPCAGEQDIIAELADIEDIDYSPPPEVMDDADRSTALTNLTKLLVHNQVNRLLVLMHVSDANCSPQDAVGQILVRNNHIRELEELKRGLSPHQSGTYITGLHAVHKELMLKRETETARKEAISREKGRILLQGGPAVTPARLNSLKELLGPASPAPGSPPSPSPRDSSGNQSPSTSAQPESASLLPVPLSLSELNVVIGDRMLQRRTSSPSTSSSLHADGASAQLINLLRDALVSEAHAQKALEAEVKLLRVQLDAEIASKKVLQDKLRRLRQRMEEDIEAIVEERLQRRLAQKREKMSEVMTNFLNKLGPSGFDLSKAPPPSDRSPSAMASSRTLGPTTYLYGSQHNSPLAYYSLPMYLNSTGRGDLAGVGEDHDGEQYYDDEGEYYADDGELSDDAAYVDEVYDDEEEDYDVLATTGPIR